MATGTINSEQTKITVSFPNSASTEYEELYKVQYAGTSEAEPTLGEPVISNVAKVKREKRATISISGGGSSPSSLCNTLTITTKNVKKNSLTIAQYPDFVNTIEIRWISEDTYVLEYCAYPNYGDTGDTEYGNFVVAGIDIYGHVVTSDDLEIENSGGAQMGDITLRVISEVPIPYFETQCVLEFAFNPSIICGHTIEVASTSGNITGVTMGAIETSTGQLTVKFPANTGTNNTGCTYTVKVKGLNVYGDVVPSNEVTFTQGVGEKSSQFFVSGDDIPNTATSAVFNVTCSQNIVQSSIGVATDRNGNPIIHNCTNPIVAGTSITVETTQNTSSSQKDISLTVSANTTDGKTVYADGILFQNAGFYLTVPQGTDVPYYSQSHSFRYSSLNVTGITASGSNAFISANGRVTINTTTKTVSLTFSKNETSEIKTFDITLKGYNTSGAEVTATYTFTQDKFGVGEFQLSPLEGFSESTPTSGSILHSTTTFKLSITYPPGNGYSSFGVCLNESTSNRYRVYSTTIQGSGDTGRTLVCEVSPNNGNTQCIYTLQVSAVTSDNRVKYTNEFEILHKINSSSASIEFTNPDGGTVPASADGKTGIGFSLNNISFAYIKDCSASDGATVSVVNFTHNQASGSFDIIFPPYPAASRTITISLGGVDNVGNPVYSTRDYVLRQSASGQPGITVTPNPKELTGNTPETFSYTVTYVGVTPMTPIYNSSIFTAVGYANGSNTARITQENQTMGQITHTITFRGSSQIDGSTMYAELTVVQPGRVANGKIIISSNQTLLQNNVYVISANGGSYPLYIETQDVDRNTLVAFVDSSNATANTIGQRITFDPVQGGGPSPHTNQTGYVVDDSTVEMPFANNSFNYFPELFTISKNEPDMVSGSTNVYFVEIRPDTGESVTAQTTVYVTGYSYSQQVVTSVSKIEPNKRYITFLQSGTTEGDEEDCDYSIVVNSNLTPPSANVKLDYSGTLSPLHVPLDTCRSEGDAVRLIAVADGYVSQIIIDTEDMEDDVETNVNLRAIGSNELVVRLLNFSTQHTNHYVSYNQNGTTINVTVRAYIAAAQFRECRVSFIVDHGNEYVVNAPGNADIALESTLSTTTDILYVEFALQQTTTSEQFTVTNSTTTYTFNITIV